MTLTTQETTEIRVEKLTDGLIKGVVGVVKCKVGRNGLPLDSSKLSNPN